MDTQTTPQMLAKGHYGAENDLNLHMVIALNRVTNQVNRAAAAALRAEGLTLMQFAVLEALYHKGDLCVGEIADVILTTGGNLTVVLANLEKCKFIKRSRDPRDSRMFRVALMDAGRKKVEEVFPRHLEAVCEALSGFTDEEKRQIVSSLIKGRRK